jgi:hypothetical protein
MGDGPTESMKQEAEKLKMEGNELFKGTSKISALTNLKSANTENQ